jgi:hypothetical protein
MREVGWGRANKGVMENVGLSMEKESSSRKKATYAGVVSRGKRGEAF